MLESPFSLFGPDAAVSSLAPQRWGHVLRHWCGPGVSNYVRHMEVLVEESRMEKFVRRIQRKQGNILVGLCLGSSYCPGLHPALVLPVLALLEQGFLLLSAWHLHPGTPFIFPLSVPVGHL